MADKKISKKDAQEILTTEQLTQKVADLKNDLIEAKRSLAAGELANPRVINKTRKQIAQHLTALNLLKRTEKEKLNG